MIRKTRFAAFLILLASVALAAQQPAPHPTTAAEAPNRDSVSSTPKGRRISPGLCHCPPPSARRPRRRWPSPRPTRGRRCRCPCAAECWACIRRVWARDGADLPQ